MTRRGHGGRSFEPPHEDKVLFPRAGITKGELIDHHGRAADRILPHLRDRPLVLQRLPDGIAAVASARSRSARTSRGGACIALHVRALLAPLGMPSYANVTGMHVSVPLDRSADFTTVRGFARTDMQLPASRHPDTLTPAQGTRAHRGRVLLRSRGRCARCPAPRSRCRCPGASSSAAASAPPRSPCATLRRTAGGDDPWADMRRLAHSQASAIGRLDRLRRSVL